MGKTVPDQPIHDRARSKPEVIDEAGTSGAEAQTISPLRQHAQVWLHVSTKNSRIKIGAQTKMANQNLRRDTDQQGERGSPRKRKRNMCKILSEKKQEGKKQVQEGGEWEHE